MSEWSYYDKNDTIKNVKKAAEASEDGVREIKRLRDENKALRDEMRALQDGQKKMTEAFNRVADELRRMREEMYPNVTNTKPRLRKPGQKANAT